MKWPPKTSQAAGRYTLFESFFVDNEVEDEKDKKGKKREKLIQKVYHLDEKEFRKGAQGEVLINAHLVFPIGKDPLQKSRTFDELFQEGKTRHFTRRELGIWSKSELTQLLKKHNDVEFLRARTALENWLNESHKYPRSEDVQLQVKYHEGVLGKFSVWHGLNGFVVPGLERDRKALAIGAGSPQPENTSSSVHTGEESLNMRTSVKPLRLRPINREKLNGAIVERVFDLVETGRCTMEQAFEMVSKNSKAFFGRHLTKGAVEGRFKRNKKGYKYFPTS